MSAEKSVKKIRIMTETGCSCVAERLFFRMMNVKRIALSFLLLAFFAVLVSAVGFDNKASSPLLILSSILALLFLCLLLYVLKIRPEMIGNIRKEDRMQGEGVFTPSSFSVDFGDGKINLDYNKPIQSESRERRKRYAETNQSACVGRLFLSGR